MVTTSAAADRDVAYSRNDRYRFVAAAATVIRRRNLQRWNIGILKGKFSRVPSDATSSFTRRHPNT